MIKLCCAPDARTPARHMVLRETGVPLSRYLAAIEAPPHTRNALKAKGLLR